MLCSPTVLTSRWPPSPAAEQGIVTTPASLHPVSSVVFTDMEMREPEAVTVLPRQMPSHGPTRPGEKPTGCGCYQ